MKTQGIRLNSNEQKKLKELSKIRNRSMNYLIREAVDRYLKEEEQYEIEKVEDMQRYREYLDTGVSISHKDIKSWLNQKKSEARKHHIK